MIQLIDRGTDKQAKPSIRTGKQFGNNRRNARSVLIQNVGHLSQNSSLTPRSLSERNHTGALSEGTNH